MASVLDVKSSMANTNRDSLATADAYNRLLADIQELAPVITGRATEIEAGRRVPLDLVDRLRTIGIFRMFVPRSHGGMELDMPRGTQVIEILSKIDSSIGWIAMIGSGSAVLAPLLPRDSYESVYRHGPDVVFAGSAQPAGTAESVNGGWRVNGRWPFASGCQHADWLFGLCVMKKDGKPLPGPAEGVPMLRACILPVGDWRIEDTWHVTGLKGTGSPHIVLEDALVPTESFVDVGEGKPCIPGALYYAFPQLIPLMHGAVHLGIAEGALNDLVEQANTGWQQQRATKPTKDSEIFQYELGRIAADLRAAKAFHNAQTLSHWQHAVAGTLKDAALLVEGSQSGIWITAACSRVVEGSFALGGGVALYESSPLQRRSRDMHAAAQHAVVQQRHYLNAGAQLLRGALTTPIAGD